MNGLSIIALRPIGVHPTDQNEYEINGKSKLLRTIPTLPDPAPTANKPLCERLSSEESE